MNRKQIERFIKKIYPKYPVKLVYFTDKSIESYWGKTLGNTEKPEIHLNLYDMRRKIYRDNDNLLIKALLLHEIAHVMLYDKHIKDFPDLNNEKYVFPQVELETHMHAIEVAEKLKMDDIRKELIRVIWYWQDVHVSIDKPYREAYKLSLKNKKMVALYRKHGFAFLEADKQIIESNID